jgi:hypothetical protein
VLLLIYPFVSINIKPKNLKQVLLQDTIVINWYDMNGLAGLKMPLQGKNKLKLAAGKRKKT